MSLETFIIGVSGHTGSGKNVIGDIAKALGHYCFDMGDVVRVIEPANRGIPKESMTKELEKQIRNELREKYGQDAIALVASEHIKGRQASVVFVTDIVSDAEISRFKKEFGNNFYTIAIVADYAVRLKRVTSRWDRPRDKSYVDDRDKWAEGVGLPRILDNADYVIENNADNLAEFQGRAMGLISKILRERLLGILPA